MPDMTLSDAAEEFLIYQENIRNLSPNSITGYRNDLSILSRCICKIRNISYAKKIASSNKSTDSVSADSLPTESKISVDSIKLEELRRCVGILTKSGKSAASINRFIAAVRSLFAYCRRLNYIKSNPALELKTVKLPVRIPRFMTAPEVDVLCAEPVVDEILWESRDHAIFEMLYSSGCRVSELAALKISDLSANLSSAIVMGKGRKERRVFFADDAVKALKEYIVERKSRVKDFVTKKTGDKISCKPVRELFINQQGTALTSRGIRYIITRYSGTEGTNKPVSPHAFRHTFATAMLSAGADVRVVQELLGHSSISTTQRYTHITTAQLIQTYNRSHPHGSDS